MFLLAWEIIKFDTVRQWIERYGYAALFGFLFTCGLGLPVPEDIPLIISGILIFHGKMSPFIAGPIAWLGIMSGDTVLYLLGYHLGHNVSRVPFIGKHVNAARLQRAEKLFVEYGVWVIAVGRLFMGVRGAMVVAAGTSRFKYLKFILVDGLAAVASGGMFMCLGYWGAAKGPALWETVREFRLGTVIVGGIGAVILFTFIWLRSRKPSKKASQPASAGQAS